MNITDTEYQFPFRFTGQKLDPETGLYYYKARYYDPALGRFLQVDPIGYEDQQNLYAYVANDPINNIDPDGRVIFGLASKAFKVLRKGGDVGATFAGAAADTRAVLAAPGTSTLGARALAALSLASEIASPVSGREVKAGVAAVRGAGNAADAAKASKGTDFAVTSKGEAISIPDGASGPNPTINKGGNEAGFEFTGGSGGKGMDSKVNGVRIMDANKNQGPRVNFMNQNR